MSEDRKKLLQKERARKYYERNKELVKERTAKWQTENKEKYKQIYKKCVSTDAGKAKKNAATAKRRAMLKQALPLWANLDAIHKIYVEASKSGMEVDHIIPLQGENVCGLHVILPANVNRKKGNKYNV